MNRFAALFVALDATTSTTARTAALADYLATAPHADRVWTIALLSGRRPRRAVTAAEVRQWAAEAAQVPGWLFEESYALVGDLAETVALILPPPARGAGPDTPLAPPPAPGASLADTMALLTGLQGQPPQVRRDAIVAAWAGLPVTGRFVFTKLLTGGFRMGVSQGLMTRALAQATGQDSATLAHRLMGDWDPATTAFDALVRGGGQAGVQVGARPYPFALASALEGGPEGLGAPADWLAEWKWDGIRGQLIARADAFALWSRGEDLLTDRFPEFAPLARFLPPGTVLDGEVLAWDIPANRPLPFAALQTRIARKKLPASVLRSAPARFVAYDLLEDGGQDIRALPQDARRARLDAMIAALPPGLPIGVSDLLRFDDWAGLAALRATARRRGCEGLMLKRAASAGFTGRKRGDWWKWKLDPYSVDAVMIYAQAGHGRRAGLYTDFTFALRGAEGLVPFAKAYSGLTDAEFAEITAWVQKHTLDRFGPVRRVPPDLVFEIAFEGLQSSPRHKSGIAVRFPRILRWRRDKPAAEIDTIDALRGLLAAGRGASPPHPPPHSPEYLGQDEGDKG